MAKKIFQPKVIIGSIVTFITGAISIIAIFFPSVFNLETKKIDELKMFVNTENDSKNLYEFLKKHENKIIKLDLSYVNYHMVYDMNTGFSMTLNDKDEIEYYNNTIYYYVGDTCVSQQLKKEWYRNPKIYHGIHAYQRRNKKPEKYCFSPTGQNHLFSVISEVNIDEHWAHLYRENGGFGFWNPTMKVEYTRGNNSIKVDFAYQIAIPHKSKKIKNYINGT